MKQRVTYILIIVLLMITGCTRPGQREEDEQSKEMREGRGFKMADQHLTVDVLLPTTPVKDQGKTELCWVYAMLAAIESNQLAKGDSVNLSPLWLERKAFEEAAQRNYLTGERINLRGTLMEAMRLYNTYGIVPYDSYHTTEGGAMEQSAANTRVLARKVMKMSSAYRTQQKGLKSLSSAVTDLLDNELGCAPLSVFMLGAEYTMKQFATSCTLPDAWTAYTSFTHHPFGQPFAVEVPDNYSRLTAQNIPIDSLTNIVINSLRNHHPVAWEGKMDSYDDADPASKIDSHAIQQKRQTAFERGVLTDDHCMTIVGLLHDARGQRYFIAKNSWGVSDGKKGFRVMSIRDFMMNTIMIMATK